MFIFKTNVKNVYRELMEQDVERAKSKMAEKRSSSTVADDDS